MRQHLAADPGPARGLDDVGPPTLPGPAKQDGPTAELVVSTRTEGGDDSFVFRVIYRDVNAAVRVASLDDRDIRITGPDGTARRAVFINVDDAVDGPTRVARYKFAPPGGSWDAGDNGAYRVIVQADEVFDTLGAAAAAGEIGQLRVELQSPPESEPPFVGLYGMDPAQFGAYPNDGLDDTAGIQAAIDALPTGPGVPIGSTPAGGIVLLREGVYDTSSTIWLHSGVTLRGAGPQTVLRNRGTNIYQNALALYSPFTHHFNVGVTVDRMTINSVNGGGVGIDAAMDGDVQDLRLADLRVSTAGPGINLSGERVYYSEIENVEIYDPGSTALRFGKDDGSNHVNRIRNVSVTGVARPEFRREQALVYINADVLVQGLSISTRGAGVMPLYMTNRSTMSTLTLNVPAADCPDGYAAVFEKMGYTQIDHLEGVGEDRRILLIDSYNVDIGVMSTDGSSDLVSELATVDATSHLRVRNAVRGQLFDGDQQLNGGPGPDVLPPPTRVVDARQYGVIPTDELDDTLQLQAAINSLPLYNPATGTGGGIVQLPLGNINASAPIKLPSGVWLRGHGNGTTIQNWTTLGANRAVIELTGDAVGHSNVGAGIVELGLRGENCSAIRPDEFVWNDVDHLLVRDVRLKGGSRGIDLRGARVTNSTIERVVMTDPASTALWLGRTDNSSYGNLVRAFRVMGRAPLNFVAETALFVYHGSNRVESGSIEDTYATVLPIYVAGPRVTLLDVYMEYPPQSNGIGYVFDRVQDGYVSHLWHVDPQRKIYLTGNSNVRFGTVITAAVPTPLSNVISVEGGSHATFDTVITHFDAGLLDDPSVTVNGQYSLRARRYVDTRTAMRGNILADPGMTDVSDSQTAQWEIYWGDTPGTVQGDWAVETVNGKKRLRLTVLSNPNNLRVSVRIRLNASAYVGREAVARWRVDGDGEVFAWRASWDAEYQARVTNSLTAMASPKPLAADEMLWFDLRAAQGTYYLSNVGVTLA